MRKTRIEEVPQPPIVHHHSDMFCDLCGAPETEVYTDAAFAGYHWGRRGGKVDLTISPPLNADDEAYLARGIALFNHQNVDICPDCAKDKLIPWLKSQGWSP